MITAKTQLNAVIGFPIDHSLSPALHNAVYRKLGIDAVMLAFAHRDVKKVLSCIKTLQIGLTAVTMPFKQTIMPFLDKIDKQAEAMGAVNTVINRRGKLIGFNTDIDGIALALKNVPIKNKNALIIGAGGAARAIAHYLKKQGCKIFYLNRTRTKAEKLKKDFGGRIARPGDLRIIDIIINATPIGMGPMANVSPLPRNILRKDQYIFDLVYNPVNTRLAKDARAAGAKAIVGIEMFVRQALKQIELYTGKKILNNSIIRFAKKLLA